MDKEFIMGLMLGAVVAAYVVTKSKKAQEVVKKGEEKIEDAMKKTAKQSQ